MIEIAQERNRKVNCNILCRGVFIIWLRIVGTCTGINKFTAVVSLQYDGSQLLLFIYLFIYYKIVH